MNNQEAILAFDRALTKQYEFDLDLAAGRAHSILCSTETETQPVNANFINTLEILLTKSLTKVSAHQAAPVFERLLHLFENTVGPNAPQVAAILYTLGEIYVAQRVSPFDESALNHFRPALLAFKRALALVETGGSRDFPYPTISLLSKRLRDIRSSSVNEYRNMTTNHAKDLVELFHLAKSYLSQGAVGDAEWLLKRVIVLAVNEVQEHVHLLASCYHLLAQMHSSRQRYLEAERIYAHCWQLLEGAPSSSPISPADLDETSATPLDEIMADWARLYEQMGIARKARACWRRAISAAKERGAHTSIAVVRSYLSLARNYCLEKRFEDALKNYHEAVEAMFVLGIFQDRERLVYISPAAQKISPRIVISLATELFLELAQCHSMLGNHDLALETLGAVIPFLQGEDNPSLLLNSLLSGVVLSCQAGAKSEALKYLERAHNLRWENHHEKACEAAETLVHVGLLDPAKAVYLRIVANCRLDESRIDYGHSLSLAKSFIGLAKICSSIGENKEAQLYAKQADGVLLCLPEAAGKSLRKEVDGLLGYLF